MARLIKYHVNKYPRMDHMDIYGHIRTFTDIYGHIQTSTDIYEHIWTYILSVNPPPPGLFACRRRF